MATNPQTKKVTLHFMSGVEEFFGERSRNIDVPAEVKKMTQFIRYLYNETFKDNPGRDEILIDEDTVKPGILVLHNNRDINLFTYQEDLSTSFKDKTPFPPEPKPDEQKEKLRIADGDEISFLSIIHGG
ncbi:hypothetical protein FO519_006055 [Halicephalobus sp. NKZ332]|nr:hypothetical protein FO519_006055 [Halicephalobus sp. NKZ332]